MSWFSSINSRKESSAGQTDILLISVNTVCGTVIHSIWWDITVVTEWILLSTSEDDDSFKLDSIFSEKMWARKVCLFIFLTLNIARTSLNTCRLKLTSNLSTAKLTWS